MTYCNICESLINDDEMFYFDDDGEFTYCEECFIQKLAKEKGLIQ